MSADRIHYIPRPFWSCCAGCSLDVYFGPEKIASHILGCGHIVCDRCKIKREQSCGKVRCFKCKEIAGTFPMPSKIDLKSSPRIVTGTLNCTEHSGRVRFECPCKALVCVKCINSSHAQHYNYAEMLAVEDRLIGVKQKMKDMKTSLKGERRHLYTKKKELDDFMESAKAEIIAKFTLIMAQTISRCMDLMAQAEAVGDVRYNIIDKRILQVDVMSRKIETISEMSDYNETRYICIDQCLKNASCAIMQSIGEELEELRGGQQLGSDRSTAHKHLVLNLSYPANIFNHIASLGKVIKTNLLDIDGNTHQVATMSTPLVTHTYTNLDVFNRFYKTLAIRKTMSKKNAPILYGIESPLASLAVMPSHEICVEAVQSSDPSDHSIPQYRLAVAASGNSNAARITSNRGQTRVQKRAGHVEVVSSSLINESGTSALDVPSTIQPGPSSPKRIKMEEEEEIDGSNQMEDLMRFAEDCEKAVKYEEEMATFMEDEVKIEVDEGGG